MNPDATTALLAAILTGTPSLPEAACRQRAPLFDDRHDGESAERQRQRLDAARDLCQGCQAQTACRTAPRDSRYGGIGVQAGRVLVAPARRHGTPSTS